MTAALVIGRFAFTLFSLKETDLTSTIVLGSSLLAVVLALALVRERRLRMALQAVVARLFHLWRQRHEETSIRQRDANSRPGGRV